MEALDDLSDFQTKVEVESDMDSCEGLIFKVTKIEPQKFRNGPKEQQMRIEDNSDSTSKKSDRVMMESFRANIVQNKVNAIKNEMDDKLLTSERYR